MGNPDALFEMSQKRFKIIMMIINYTKQNIKTTSLWDVQLCTHSPALGCLPFLEVTYVIDRAVHCHVIVVAGNVECIVKFNGPL